MVGYTRIYYLGYILKKRSCIYEADHIQTKYAHVNDDDTETTTCHMFQFQAPNTANG